MQVSNTFRNILAAGAPAFHMGADITLKSGATLNLSESDFMADTFKITDSVSSDQTLEVGAATARQFDASLNNFSGKFTDSEFDSAVIKPYVDLVTGSDWKQYMTERCNCGIFTVNDTKSVENAIQITALDDITKFDQPYTKSTLKYPATLGQILADACSCCGVALATATFTNSDFSVASRPTDGALTFRDIVSYVGQLSGNFCRCNANGALELRWYGFTKFSLTDTDQNRPWDILGIVSSDIKKADTSVTGVKITGNDDAKTVYQAGTDGFVILISNPLAQGNLQAVANALGSKLIGMAFRPFTAQASENPAIEAGDVCYMRDTDGNKYKSIISNLVYTVGQNESYSGDAESAAENNSTYYSDSDKAQETADSAQKAAADVSGEVELAKADIGKLSVRVTATEDGLESKVSKDDISSEIQQHPQDVVFAFNNLSGTQSLKFTGDGFDVYNGATKIAHIGIETTSESGTGVQTYTAIQSVDDSSGIALRPNNGKGLYILNSNSNQSGYDLMHMGSAFFENGVASHGLISTTKNMDCDALACNTLKAKSGTLSLGGYVTAGQLSSSMLGQYATAEGYGVTASGKYSHAEGCYTTASGEYSHAEGSGTTASDYQSHAEGGNTVASKATSHAEGNDTIASGYGSHAEGEETVASGDYSHAEGEYTTASGNYSHAEGEHTTAHDYCEHAGGEYSKISEGDQYSFATSNNAFVIGNGTSNIKLSNCFRVDFSGHVYGLSAFNSSGADYAEYFEWADGNPNKEDRVGRFVTLDGAKIRYAKPGDDILGIVSGCPTVIGDAASESWGGRYARDIFGRVILENVNVPDEYDKSGKIVHKAHTELRQKINPNYDPKKENDYVSREKRPEWSAVGMHGKIVMIDDGTCKPNGYCGPASDGTAKAAKKRNNCRVMERLDNTHIRVCLK